VPRWRPARASTAMCSFMVPITRPARSSSADHFDQRDS
jgi:hypothetical protein